MFYTTFSNTARYTNDFSTCVSLFNSQNKPIDFGYYYLSSALYTCSGNCSALCNKGWIQELNWGHVTPGSTQNPHNLPEISHQKWHLSYILKWPRESKNKQTRKSALDWFSIPSFNQTMKFINWDPSIFVHYYKEVTLGTFLSFLK